MTTHTQLRLGAVALMILLIVLLSGSHLCGVALNKEAADPGMRPIGTGALACTEFWLNRYQTLEGAITAVGAAVAAWRLSLNQIAKAQGQIDQMEKQTSLISQQSNAVVAEQIGSIISVIDDVLISVQSFNDTIFEFDHSKFNVMQLMMSHMLQYGGQNSAVVDDDDEFGAPSPDANLIGCIEALAAIVDKQKVLIYSIVRQFPSIVWPQNQIQDFDVHQCRAEISRIYQWQNNFTQLLPYLSAENIEESLRGAISVNIHNFIGGESEMRSSLYAIHRLPFVLEASREALTAKRKIALAEMIK